MNPKKCERRKKAIPIRFTKSRFKNNKIWEKVSQRGNWKLKTSYGKALIDESERRSAHEMIHA